MKHRGLSILIAISTLALSACDGVSETPLAANTSPIPEETIETISVTPTQVGITNEFTPAYERSPCPFDLPADTIEGSDIECGYVTVPEEHTHPQGETIRLAFAIIKSTSESPEPDPLVIETGGPGVSTLASAPALISMPDLRAHRDIVMIEQRGTRFSEPNLYCDEIIEAVKESLTQGVSDAEKATRLENALTACRGRLVSQGIHLSAYDSLENAADIPMVLSALGYDSYNFYGISYATRLAQHLMRDHPESLRSVIIDAPVPLSVDYAARAPESVARAFKQLFAGCADDPLCNEAYPDLENVFYDLVDAYDETPIRVHFEEPEAVDIEVTGKTLVWMLYQHLYIAQTIPFLPMFIYALEDGGHDLITTFGLPAMLSTPTNGMSYSVRCAEETFTDMTASDYHEIHPQISTLMIEYLNSQEACDIWDVESIGQFQPVESDIPTLILSGEFDPITPPEFGKILAETLSSSYSFTFPGMGHGAFTKHPCPNSMVMGFLEDPSGPPDAACLDEMNIKFATPTQSGEFEMESFTDENAGMQAVRPLGWTEVGPGVYMLISEDDDLPTLFEQVRLPDQPLEYQIASWLPAYGIEAFPESIAQSEHNGLTWDLYHFTANMPTLGEMLVDVAIAEKDKRYYFIGLYAPPGKYADMHEWVFIPALEGLRAYP